MLTFKTSLHQINQFLQQYLFIEFKSFSLFLFVQ